jgi:uncharacterized protein (DUF427 family)
MTARALYQGTVIAESDETLIVEGNHYFPASSVKREFLEDSSTTTGCPWKGTAHYYSVVVGEDRAQDAAWYYPEPLEKASAIRDAVAFWKGVTVEAGSEDGTPGPRP